MARKLEVEIVGDASSLHRALGRADQSTNKLGRSFMKLGKAGAVGLGIAVGAAAVGMNKAIDAASNLGESVNAVKVVFGSASKQVLAFSEGAARKAGLSMREFNELVTPVGAGLRNAGLGMDEAAKKSIALTQRAADMASVFNTSVPEALQAIQGGLRGESDPLEKFGVGLQDAAVKAKAVSMGFKLVKGNLDPMAKAQARYALIMDQTNRLQGDFKNTSGGMANQQRIMRAELENSAAAIGKWALPLKTAVVSFIANEAIPALDKFGKSFKENVVPQIQRFVDFVKAHMPEIRAQIFSMWASVQPVLKNLGQLFVTVVGLIRKHWGTIGPILNTVLSIVRAVVNNIAGIIKVFASVLKGDWGAAWNALKGLARNALSAVLAYMKLWRQTIGAAALRAAQEIVQAIGRGLAALPGVAAKGLKALPHAIRVAADAAVSLALSAGRAVGTMIVQGIAAGIRAAPGILRDAVVSAVKGAFAAGKAWLLAHSPSQRAAKELGKPIGDGIAQGIKQSEMAVINALRGVLSNAVRGKNFGNVSSIIQSMFGAVQGAVRTPAERRIASMERMQNLQDLNQAITDGARGIAEAQEALARAQAAGTPQEIQDARRAVEEAQRSQERNKQALELFHLQEQAAKERAKLDAKQLAQQIQLGARLDQLSKLFDRHHVTIGALLAAVRRILRGLHVPGYAKGGVVMRPTLAMVGEAGPEAIVPLSGRGAMSSGGPMTVNLQLDGRTLARLLVDPLRGEVKQLRAAGGSF